MIKIKVDYKENFISSFKVSGHANYDEYGKDIVCSSVSSIVITSINLALKLKDNAVSVKQSSGLIDAKVLVFDDVINKVFVNMIDMLQELENDYKDNIKIRIGGKDYA